MNQPVPTGPDLFAFAEASYGKARSAGSKPDNPTFGSPEELYHFMAATFHAQQANTAALVMLAECVTTIDHFDFDGWREKIGMTWLKECRGKDLRRPQCTPTHTEDCAFADPVPEPKHVRIPVGTRVLVSDLVYNSDTKKPERTNPQPGRISSYAPNGTYRWQREYSPGVYASHESFAFMDNRVRVHPDGPTCPPNPAEVKQPPTGPRVYVKHLRGKDGHVVDFARKKDADLAVLVQWHTPGTVPVWVSMGRLTVIHPDEVSRCPNGQTGDECGSGENQCEPCVQADDEEGDEIERSMGLQ